MGIFGHWYVILILLVLLLILLGPRTLPRLGSLFGRRMRETRQASIEAGKAFKSEVLEPDQDPPKTPPPG